MKRICGASKQGGTTWYCSTKPGAFQLKCKMLMQAGPCWDSLGASSTNMYAYKIWPHTLSEGTCDASIV